MNENFDNYGIHSRPVHTLPSLAGDDIVKLQKKAYMKFYFRPNKILNQLLNLKTYERVKFNLKAVFNIFKILKGDV